jgi:hypothetical protein
MPVSGDPGDIHHGKRKSTFGRSPFSRGHTVLFRPYIRHASRTYLESKLFDRDVTGIF